MEKASIQMNPTKIIATYSRVSTSNQEEQETIKTQLNTLAEFAIKNNYSIVKQYIDDGWSGDVLMRPELDKLREDAKSKQWEAVLIYDPDRLARRYSYQELIMDELREAGIEIIFVTISAPKNSEDKILYGVRGLFAEYERTKISERFRLGKIRKVKEGNVLLSEAPYGYNYIPKRENISGYLEINENEARVVKMIFHWVADEGLPIRKIILKLQELGIPPRKSTRGDWSQSTISSIIKNRTYYGDAHWGISYSVVPKNPTSKEKYRKLKKTSRKLKNESEWIKIKVPAIIEKELHERANRSLSNKFKLNIRQMKNQYLLNGKIVCSCGYSRTGEGVSNGKFLYYRCSKRINQFPLPRTCFEGAVNARNTDKLVWDKILELMCSPELLYAQAQRWVEAKKQESSISEDEIKIIETEIEKLKIEEDRFTKAYGAGLFTIEKLSEYLTPIRKKLELLNAQIEKVGQKFTRNKDLILPSINQIEEFTKNARALLVDLSYEDKKSIIINVIDKIIVGSNKLVICGSIPMGNNYNIDNLTHHTFRVNIQPIKESIEFFYVIQLKP